MPFAPLTQETLLLLTFGLSAPLAGWLWWQVWTRHTHDRLITQLAQARHAKRRF